MIVEPCTELVPDHEGELHPNLVDLESPLHELQMSPELEQLWYVLGQFVLRTICDGTIWMLKWLLGIALLIYVCASPHPALWFTVLATGVLTAIHMFMYSEVPSPRMWILCLRLATLVRLSQGAKSDPRYAAMVQRILYVLDQHGVFNFSAT